MIDRARLMRTNTASSMTNVICGIETTAADESRFQRWLLCVDRSWGVAPGSCEGAPLALNEPDELLPSPPERAARDKVVT